MQRVDTVHAVGIHRGPVLSADQADLRAARKDAALNYRLHPHAQEEANRRGIPPELLNAMLIAPQQVVSGQRERKVYQSRVQFPDGRVFLLRAVVDEREEPPLVLTVYRSSKIEKYWSVK